MWREIRENGEEVRKIKLNNKSKKKRGYFFSTIICSFIILCITACGKDFNKEQINNGKSDNMLITDEKKEVVKNDERVKQAEKNGDVSLIVSNEKAQAGERVCVMFYLANNPGILGMSGTLSYDEESISLEKIEMGDDFKNVLELTNSENLSTGCRILLSGEEISSEQTFDGIILKLEFLVHKSTNEMKTPVTFVPDQEGVYDNKLLPISLLVENGYITILPDS